MCSLHCEEYVLFFYLKGTGYDATLPEPSGWLSKWIYGQQCSSSTSMTPTTSNLYFSMCSACYDSRNYPILWIKILMKIGFYIVLFAYIEVHCQMQSKEQTLSPKHDPGLDLRPNPAQLIHATHLSQ